MKKILLCMIIIFVVCCGLQKNLRVLETRESSIIGISIRTAHLFIFSNSADVVYFVKLDENDMDNIGDEIFPSNYTRGDYAYLINAKPGKYAAIGSSFTQTDDSYNTFFDAKTIQSTVIDVGPGTIVYAGSLVIENKMKNLYQNIDQSGDKAQLHYYNMLKSNMYGAFYCGSLRSRDLSKESEKYYLIKTKKYFKDSEWIPIIEQKIETMGK